MNIMVIGENIQYCVIKKIPRKNRLHFFKESTVDVFSLVLKDDTLTNKTTVIIM